MKHAFILWILLMPIFCLSQTNETLKTRKYAGIYSFGQDVEKMPVGNLTIYPETDSTILFYIDICRGAPSYNLGQHYGRLLIKNGRVIFYSKEDYAEKVEIPLKEPPLDRSKEPPLDRSK